MNNVPELNDAPRVLVTEALKGKCKQLRPISTIRLSRMAHFGCHMLFLTQ